MGATIWCIVVLIWKQGSGDIRVNVSVMYWLLYCRHHTCLNIFVVLMVFHMLSVDGGSDRNHEAL